MSTPAKHSDKPQAEDMRPQRKKPCADSDSREEEAGSGSTSPKTVDVARQVNSKDKIINQKSNDDVQIIFVQSESQNEFEVAEEKFEKSQRSHDSVIDQDFFKEKKLVESDREETETGANSGRLEPQSEAKSLNLQVISLPSSKYYIEQPRLAKGQSIGGALDRIKPQKKVIRSFYMKRDSNAKSIHSRENNE